jgi:hypothetical protein
MHGKVSESIELSRHEETQNELQKGATRDRSDKKRNPRSKIKTHRTQTQGPEAALFYLLWSLFWCYRHLLTTTLYYCSSNIIMSAGTKRSTEESSRPNNQNAKVARVIGGEAQESPRLVEANNAGSAAAAAAPPNGISFMEPITPRLDPFLDPPPHQQHAFLAFGNNPVNTYIIYMAVRETQPSPFSIGLDQCAATCRRDIHQTCFQADGTRHVTLWQGKLTDRQASRIKFPSNSKASSNLPISIDLDGWTSWTAGLYLKLTSGTTSKLENLLKELVHLDSSKGGKRSCNHLSLYRKRGATNASDTMSQFTKVRAALASHDWKSVEGVSVRIKIQGTGYDECRILAGGK